MSIEPGDLDLSPFDRKGGLGRFYDVFGPDYEAVLREMNIADPNDTNETISRYWIDNK